MVVLISRRELLELLRAAGAAGILGSLPRWASAETSEQHAKERLSARLWTCVEENPDQPLDAIVASFKIALQHDPLYDRWGLKEKGTYETLEAIARGLGPFIFFAADYNPDPALLPNFQSGVPFVCGSISQERNERYEDGTCLRLHTLEGVKSTLPFRGLTFTYPKSEGDRGDPTYLIVVNRDVCTTLVEKRWPQLGTYNGSPRDGASGSIAEPVTLGAYYLAVLERAYRGVTHGYSADLEVEDALAHERLHAGYSEARARSGKPLRRSPEEREGEEAVIGAELLWGAETRGDAARALLAPIELVLYRPDPSYAIALLQALGDATREVTLKTGVHPHIANAVVNVTHDEHSPQALLLPDVSTMQPEDIREIGRLASEALYSHGFSGRDGVPGRSR